MHSDLQPEVGGSGAYALIMHLLGERVGMPVAEGGSGAVSAALAAALRYAGGVIATGRRVDRIVVEHGGRSASRPPVTPSGPDGRSSPRSAPSW